jgi:MFS transporter, SP family, sugar:H+ symporter
MSKFNPFAKRNAADTSNTSTAVPSARNSYTNPEPAGDISKSDSGKSLKVPNVTIRTVLMTILVAMGGFIFGYDTGQISGFLEMRVFLERFGEKTAVTDEHQFGYYFTNVRSGLIVALVCSSPIPQFPMLILSSYQLVLSSAA